MIAVVNARKNALNLETLAQVGSFWQGSTAPIWSLGALLLIFTAYLAQKEQLIYQETALKNKKCSSDCSKKACSDKLSRIHFFN